LRRAGLKAECPFSPAGVGKDLKAADRDGAPFAVIVGPDEWSRSSANLKNLRSGEERTLPLEALADAILS
jgi:histidyl-tRNA synthetase